MRSLVIVLAAIFVVLGLAGAATAQSRDPFDPLVSEADAQAPAVEPGGDVVPAPAVPAPDNERLADTGAPIAQFTGLALALIVLGAAVLLATWARRPAPRSSPRIPRRGGSVA